MALRPKNECLDGVPRSRLDLSRAHITCMLLLCIQRSSNIICDPFDLQLCFGKKTVREAVVIANHNTINVKLMDLLEAMMFNMEISCYFEILIMNNIILCKYFISSWIKLPINPLKS